mmetsp:Transcript_104853/g.240377  ORF Transcript_104853/g.240377 Transcript_104853/m.240377 type:complete len:296 (+) Transcript_104853:31-918(+)
MPLFPAAPQHLQASSPGADDDDSMGGEWEDVGDDSYLVGPRPSALRDPGMSAPEEAVAVQQAQAAAPHPAQNSDLALVATLRVPAQPDTGGLAVPAGSENESDAGISFTSLSIEPEHRPGAGIKAAKRQAKVTDAIVAKLSASFMRQCHQLVPPELVAERMKTEVVQMQEQVAELLEANAAIRREIATALAPRDLEAPLGVSQEAQALLDSVTRETAALVQMQEDKDLVLTELAELQRASSTVKLREISAEYELRVAGEKSASSLANDALQRLEDRMADAIQADAGRERAGVGVS